MQYFDDEPCTNNKPSLYLFALSTELFAMMNKKHKNPNFKPKT